MKKAIIAILLYILVMHVFIPCIYYCFFGITPIYSDLVDYPSLIKAVLLISIPLLISAFILKFSPSKEDYINPNIEGKPINVLFYFAVLLKLITFYFTGGYETILSGESNGTLMNYIFLFLNPFTLLLILLFVQKKKSNVIKAIIFYVAFVTLSGSRSGVVSVFFVFFIGLAFERFSLYKQKIYLVLKYGLIVAPFLFIYATRSRGIDEMVGVDFILNQIVGRISTLETSMLPLYYDANNLDLSLFYSKYNFWHQLKLSVDAVLPGQFFEHDVMPNNYYRSMFLGFSESFVAENYMSINFTLPVYLYLKYSYFAIPFTVLYVIVFYRILYFFRKNPLVVIAFLSSFFNLIYFFDWVMFFTQLYSSFLTIIFIKAFIPSFRILKQIIIQVKPYESTS
jgi:hypothetical protein